MFFIGGVVGFSLPFNPELHMSTRFIQHAAAAVAIAQIQTHGQSVLRKCPALLRQLLRSSKTACIHKLIHGLQFLEIVSHGRSY